MDSTHRRRLGEYLLNGVILVLVFGLGILTQRQNEAGWPWSEEHSTSTAWDITVADLSERLGSLGFSCLLHGKRLMADMGVMSAKCDVGAKRFDLAVYESEKVAIDAVHLSNSSIGCMLARLRGARHLTIAAGETWSVFTTSLEDARLIATELNGYLVTRECRSVSET